MDRKMVFYRMVRKLYLDDATCDAAEACCRPAVDVHHTRGRTGTLLLDTRFWVPVCRECHNWIQDNPAEARQARLVAPIGKWGVPMGDRLANLLKRLPGASLPARKAWAAWLAYGVPGLASAEVEEEAEAMERKAPL